MTLDDIPAWLAAACGGEPYAAERARWGFRHETWLVTAVGGQRLVVQRRADGPSPASRGPALVRGFVRDAGLRVPEPADAGSDETGRLLVTMPLVVGTVAADLLGDAAGAERAGALCGSVAARLTLIDPAWIGAVAPSWAGLRGPWTSGERLLAETRVWLDAVAGALPAGAQPELLALAERAAAETAESGARFAHGDLAPVNVLAAPAPDGTIAAVLDLDRARLAHAGYDAAWFGWVLEHHHPETASAAMHGYAGACGAAVTPAAAAWLRPLVLLERLAEVDVATRPEEHDRWAARLADALRC